MKASCEYGHEIKSPLQHAVADQVSPSFNPYYFSVQVNCNADTEVVRTHEGFEGMETCDGGDYFEFELMKIKKVGEGEVWGHGQREVPKDLSALVVRELRDLRSFHGDDSETLGGELLNGVDSTAYRTHIVDEEGDEYKFIFPMARHS